MSDEFVSPVDGHIHFGAQARNECAMCQLQDERDGLRRIYGEKTQRIVDLTARAEAAEAERDRLAMSLEEGQELHGETRAERDRLRAVMRDLLDGAVESTAATVTFPVGLVAVVRRGLDAAGEQP